MAAMHSQPPCQPQNPFSLGVLRFIWTYHYLPNLEMRGEMRDEEYVSISVLMENILCPARIICRGKKHPEGSNQGFSITVPLSLSKPLRQGLQHRLHGHSSSLQSLPLKLQNTSNSKWLHSMGPLLLTLLPHLVPGALSTVNLLLQAAIVSEVW